MLDEEMSQDYQSFQDLISSMPRKTTPQTRHSQHFKIDEASDDEDIDQLLLEMTWEGENTEHNKPAEEDCPPDKNGDVEMAQG